MATFSTVSIDGLDIFYREAGSRDNPTILLLQFYLFDTGHFALEEDGEASLTTYVNSSRHACNPSLPNQCKAYSMA
jgi:hypothetical protein